MRKKRLADVDRMEGTSSDCSGFEVGVGRASELCDDAPRASGIMAGGGVPPGRDDARAEVWPRPPWSLAGMESSVTILVLAGEACDDRQW